MNKAPDGEQSQTAIRAARPAGNVVVVQQEEPDPASPPAAGSGSLVRWFVAVVGAAIVALPLAWLLNFAASLPFFIGLFFFSLFGLIIGATCFRIALPGRPFGGGMILFGTTLLVLGTFLISIYFESASFPEGMADEAVRLPSLDLQGEAVGVYRARVASEVDTFLRDQFSPGGVLGYIRWAVGSGIIEEGRLASVPRTLKMNQSGAWWVGRVVVSMLLLAFGISSQTLPLRDGSVRTSA